MTKNILVIIGHPSKESFTKSVGESYVKGARNSGNKVELVHVSEIKFNPDLIYGYNKNQKLEKDLEDIQKKILWANHIVFVYPIWWGSMPARLKGLIDRVFLPGFAYKFEKRSILPKQLLKGKSGRIIVLKGGSKLFYFGSLSTPARTMRRFVLNFCGVSPVRTTSFYSTSHLNEKKAANIIKKAFDIGKRDA